MIESTSIELASLDTYDHVRLTEDESGRRPGDGFEQGVYRVVGTSSDAVTLLRVEDPDGRRRHTGEVISVHRTNGPALERAENPDANRSPVTVLAGQLDGLGWSLRLFGRALAARPLPAAGALLLLIVGWWGDSVFPVPNGVDGLFILAGALLLALLGYLGPK